MKFLNSEEWLDIVENKGKQDFINMLGNAIDPLTKKILDGAYGTDIAFSMPTDMHSWIKDSTVLWIKNSGGGSLAN